VCAVCSHYSEMPFLKVIKNRAYFKRFQTQFRRRREGRTDYYARRRLVTQDKNKYNSPKRRFVVRFTNRDIICQVVYSRIDGDHVIAAAYSHELPRYGIKLGLTNYAAAYATGYLLARRVLQKLKLDTKFKGTKKVTGRDYLVQAQPKGPRPFKALLDVGLARTSTGSRVFAAMKGMCDGGINVPHSEKRFVGFDSEAETLDAEVLRKYIFGGHVADYMKKLLEEDPARYDAQFSRYKKEGITADKLEAIYAEAHKQIKANPAFVPKKPKTEKPEKPKSYKKRKLSAAERKARVATKKQRLGFPEAPKPADK